VPSLLHNGVDVAPQFTHSRPSALVLDLFLEDEDEEFFMALVPGEWHEDEGCLAGEKTAGAIAEWW